MKHNRLTFEKMVDTLTDELWNQPSNDNVLIAALHESITGLRKILRHLNKLENN